jgi:L-alanine-DL-glutamate epimerase-like enolase superfamily enzyme
MSRIVEITGATLEARRPRTAGRNARLMEHGDRIRVPLLRLRTDDGLTAFGRGGGTAEQVEALRGRSLDDILVPGSGIVTDLRRFEFVLWDLLGQKHGKPVWLLAADLDSAASKASLTVRCYDTSLYFDDLGCDSDEAGAALIAEEARQGYERGHRAFKIKVGRGAWHMPLEAGIRRDIAVIRAVADTVGHDKPLMLDANNGYNLNITKTVLGETSDLNIFWMEEAFHEDPVLYRELKSWRDANGLKFRIADGEGDASPHLLRWAQEGLVEVVQYDVFGYGFSAWLELGRKLDPMGVLSAPHHYGAFLGNFISGHLAGALPNFAFVEWDEASAPWVDSSAYKVVDGQLTLPNAPGFGLHFDNAAFEAEAERTGFRLA